MSYELEYKNISRKELAHKINVPVATINRAIERDSNPFALDALRISRELGVSLEYLLDFSENEKLVSSNRKEELFQIEMYKKYHSVISILENIPSERQKTIIEILTKLSEL